MIKMILFDLDDTLFDFKACERQALSAVLRAFSLPFDSSDLSDYSAINDRMWKKLEKGEITRDALRVDRFEIFLSRFPEPPSPIDFADRYMEALADTSALIEGARELLEYLSPRYALYAVTNGYVQTQRGRILKADIGKYFRDVFISQQVGFTKPKKEFFDYCAAHIPNFELSAVVLVGDSLTSDIAGGNAYGLTTVLYDPSGEKGDPAVRPDHVIRSLSELPPLLETL